MSEAPHGERSLVWESYEENDNGLTAVGDLSALYADLEGEMEEIFGQPRTRHEGAG